MFAGLRSQTPFIRSFQYPDTRMLLIVIENGFIRVPAPQRKPILVAQDAVTPQKESGPRIPITTPKTVATTTVETTTTTPSPTTSPLEKSSRQETVNKKGKTNILF